VTQFVNDGFQFRSPLQNVSSQQVRNGLRLGTCLSGAAATLILLSATRAHAADQCGAPVEGIVSCPVSEANYPEGIDYIVDPVEPQDLTVNLGDGLAIDTGGSTNNGVHVGNLNGAVTINGAGTTITTSGVGATGMSGVTNVGDLTMHAGNVATSGYQGHGIVASASQGDIAITAGSVSTAGDVAYGISVLSDGQVGGNVAIEAVSVSTAGTGSMGIEVLAPGGDVDIKVGSVATTGDYANAIQAIAGGNLSIAADTISTQGLGSVGIVGVSEHGSVSINAGSISTAGDFAHGVYALSIDGNTNVTLDDVTTSGDRSAAIIAASVHGNTTVTVGNVQSTGFGAIGIYAFSDDGNTVVNAGDVRTLGYYNAPAIQAISVKGDATVTANNVLSSGDASAAIQVTAGGKATVNAHDIEVFGHYSGGIVAVGTSAEVNVSGHVYTHGFGANGIVAVGNAGDVSVRADDKIITTYPGSVGILGIANGNVTIDANKVYTNAYYSTGIEAVSYGREINVSADVVGARGDQSGGILALAAPADPSDMTQHDVTVTAGTITTDGTGPRAAGIVAFNANNVGDTTVTVTDSVATRRDFAQGVLAFAQNGTATVNVKDASTRGFGATAVNADGARAAVHATGSISTVGDRSSGVRGYASTSGVTITSSGSVSTSGENSYGLLAHGFGPMSVTNSGTIETSGKFGHGIYSIVSPSQTSTISIVNSGKISVSGDRADGIKAISKGGGASIVSTGSITVSGERSIGILAVGDRAGRGDRVETTALIDKTVSVNAASVTATGDGSVGIIGVNYNGDLVINSAKISSTGAGAGGITTMASGKTDIKVGSIASTSMAINSTGSGDIGITVSGAVTSSSDSAIVATSQYGNATVNIAAGGSVVGGGHRVPVYIYGGNGITIASWYGDATVNNAGFVTTKGDGYAIEVIGFSYQPTRRALINNSGRIDGAVHVTQLDDIFNNSGTFNATKDSNFDLGNDLFTNTGTVHLMTAAAANVSFLGLEKFDNKGGVVDLANGHAGDVFTLGGNYVGSGDARLALDVKGATADNFIVAGAATGKTMVELSNLGGAEARLTGAKSIAVIKVGAGSAADAFSLGTSNIGFIQYGLNYDAASGTYGLVGTAGTAVYRGLKVSEGAAAAWHQSGDVWTAHMAGLRDTATANGEGGTLWSQAYGQVNRRDEIRDVAGALGHDLGYKQDHVGGQLGYDFGQRGKFAFGVTAGYLKSTLDFSGAAETLEYGVVNLGGYAGFKAGIFFASALINYDRFRVSADSDELGYSDKFGGNGYGAQIEAGARFGSAALFAEPVASLAWSKIDLGDLRALGQSVEFDGATGLRGKIGAKVGGSHALGSGATFLFYAGGNLVREFAGEDGLTLVSGGTSEHVANAAIKPYGQGLLGLSIRSAGGISGFVEGNANFGGDYKGGGGRVGLNIKF
jgi:hypothetical protein